ncbi:MAG: sugar phosphate isomerase/epimerase [Proteobacteria bacterium]|nr:sugar phosphate isomerase/epimerase [Pseudomonadota bacterium]MBU1964973.1 sugar phosphate isomerase/epimerase [Pseudomonadota bacterium]
MHEEAEIAYLGVTVEELARVLNAIPSKYFGLTLDIAHASLLPGGPESFIDAFPNRIISTHVSDNDLILDRHVPVGDGKIDFKRVFGNLMKVNFKGTLSLGIAFNNIRKDVTFFDHSFM